MMGPLPKVFKPISREEMDKLMMRYAGKEQGVGLEDVFTREQIERLTGLDKLKPSDQS